MKKMEKEESSRHCRRRKKTGVEYMNVGLAISLATVFFSRPSFRRLFFKVKCFESRKKAPPCIALCLVFGSPSPFSSPFLSWVSALALSSWCLTGSRSSSSSP